MTDKTEGLWVCDVLHLNYLAAIVYNAIAWAAFTVRVPSLKCYDSKIKGLMWTLFAVSVAP